MSKLDFDASKVTPHEGYEDLASEPLDTTRNWSEFQHNIFNFVATGTGNAIIEAVAGSGKSSTIIESLKLAKGSTIFLAFNKAIAEELKSKGVNARTFHSLCFSAVRNHTGVSNVEGNKLSKLIRQYTTMDEDAIANGKGISSHDAGNYRVIAAKLVSLAKQAGMGFLTEDSIENWNAICIHHDIDIPKDQSGDIGRAVEVAQLLLQWSNESDMVDFDDMLFIAVRDRLSLPKFDFVFVDEAQDTNMIQREILRMISHSNSRLIAVGDPSQAIYGFRGADADSLNHIAREFNAIRLPLSISYRCSQAVVNYAKQWVPHIEAAPDAIEGAVINFDTDWSVTEFEKDDLVVCRKNAPLIMLAFRCIRSNIPVCVVGRDIGQGLITLVRQMDAIDLDMLNHKLDKFLEREVRKARKEDNAAKEEAITDKVLSLQYVIESVGSIVELEKAINYLFADRDNAVRLSSIHKAKGLEAEYVYWLNRSECPATWATQDWQLKEEIHLCYVAATRAKHTLALIEMG